MATAWAAWGASSWTSAFPWRSSLCSSSLLWCSWALSTSAYGYLIHCLPVTLSLPNPCTKAPNLRPAPLVQAPTSNEQSKGCIALCGDF